MKKFLLLAVLVLAVVGIFAQTFQVNSYQRSWWNLNGYDKILNIRPAFYDVNDLQSEILFNGVSFSTIGPHFTAIYTPYVFGGDNSAPPAPFMAQVNYPFTAGVYSVVKPPWTAWDPLSFGTSAVDNQDEDFLAFYEETNPVELSSFTATLTALNDVQISWVTQSESNMLGYRVYRHDSSLDNVAILITPTLVPAVNSTQPTSYSVTDDEVEVGTTYFYRLESVEPNHSNFHGPVSITVQGEVPPVYPEVTTLKKAYPNPFRANTSTNIEVELKDGETGTVTIYNLQGKVVKVYDVTPGSHTITWNGTDSKGAACSSGIYLYKLSTPSANATEKMVIIK
ncbi:MAG: T9SS type A sorting domain-containing protein [Candidatus Cloacimonetes bacterium]|nr:T9SS type A sorting domain-containing protein [Candidatus Cloacimonadota bacterium]